MREPLLRYIYLSLSILFCCVIHVDIVLCQEILVLDEADQPLRGVEVFTDDFAFANVTDVTGKVALTATVQKSTKLNFRYLGYETLALDLQTVIDAGNVVVLQPSDQILNEMVVYGRREVAEQEIPYQVATIKARDIASTHAQTSADALAQHGGVFVQKSQMGGGSPLIRGFEANRVLLVVDGVRLNNAIYRSGHLQNAITVDQAILEKMEVIFGPNSLLYGSDALGGVVHFTTRSPKLSIDDNILTQVDYYTRYASANGEKSAHVDLSIGGSKLGSLTSVTYTDYGDLRSGGNRDNRFPDFGKRLTFQSIENGEDVERANDNPNIQVGTAYNQVDVLQKLLYTPNADHRITANLHYSTSTDVPRYDNLTEQRNGTLRWAEWDYGPQTRLLASLDYRLLKPSAIYDDVAFIAAYQRVDEDRISRLWQSPTRSYQEEDLNVLSITIDASKYLNEENQLRLSYGLDVQHNDVLSTAFDEDINSGAITPNQLTRYASGGNGYAGLGAYATLGGVIRDDRLRYNLGLRYSRNNYNISYDRNDPVDWPEEFYTGVEGSNNALTWSIGGTWLGRDGWNIRSMISTAFRSPNIDDLAKVRVNNDEITFPNLELKPERSINAELTVAKSLGRGMKMSVTGFYTRLSDAIIRREGIGPNGEIVWDNQGEILNIVANQNTQSAIIRGVSANVSYDFTSKWSSKASWNYTNGREQLEVDGTAPFAHIPPVYGQIETKYTAERFNAKLSYRFNGMKSIDDFGGTVDNPDLATPVGSLAWSTFNLYTEYQLNDRIGLSVALENILDMHYRPFGSGVSAPGRNLVLSMRGRF